MADFFHTYKKRYRQGNCWIRPVSTVDFTASFINCEGIVCGAGFETPAEALQMGKKVLVIPMKHQYEQHCNAAGAQELGVPVIKSLKKKHSYKVENWLNEKNNLQINFPDETDKIIDLVLSYAPKKSINKPVTKDLISSTFSIAVN